MSQPILSLRKILCNAVKNKSETFFWPNLPNQCRGWVDPWPSPSGKTLSKLSSLQPLRRLQVWWVRICITALTNLAPSLKVECWITLSRVPAPRCTIVYSTSMLFIRSAEVQFTTPKRKKKTKKGSRAHSNPVWKRPTSTSELVLKSNASQKCQLVEASYFQETALAKGVAPWTEIRQCKILRWLRRWVACGLDNSFVRINLSS